MKWQSDRREPFFRNFAWIILATVIVCFGAKAIFDTKDLPPITPLHHLHAVAMLSWFVLFAVQPTLVEAGKVRAHQLLGRLSPLVVLTSFTFALQISLLNWQRMGAPLIITANGVNLTLFAGLYIAAISYRRDAATHKRLMLYATLSMMGPAFGRLPEIFDQSPVLAVPLIFGFQLAPLIHDRIVHRRIHPASWVGFALMLGAIPLILGLSGSAAWADFLEGILGPRGGQLS
ncbi:MAG: hypothetical protein R3F18_20160 [Lysobacterales bacterium]